MFDHRVIQLCRLHKIRNVKDRLLQRFRATVGRKMMQDCHADWAIEAEAAFEAIPRDLERPTRAWRQACASA